MSFSGFSDQIEQAEVVSNSEFWPDINLYAFQEEYRLPADYRKNMLISRLRNAMLMVNRSLSGWKLENAGPALSLADVPCEMLGTEHSLTLHYTRAVCSEAKALLLQDYKTVMRKSDAQSDAKESHETSAQWHQYAQDALSDFKGDLRIMVELL